MGRLCKALLELLAADSDSADSQAGIALQTTHQELADRVGTTRESVTRALGSLRKTGLVRTSGRTLILLDLAAALSNVSRNPAQCDANHIGR